jgi:hypothetical protein
MTPPSCWIPPRVKSFSRSLRCWAGERTPPTGGSRIVPLNPTVPALGALAPAEGVRGLPGESSFLGRWSATPDRMVSASNQAAS